MYSKLSTNSSVETLSSCNSRLIYTLGNAVQNPLPPPNEPRKMHEHNKENVSSFLMLYGAETLLKQSIVNPIRLILMGRNSYSYFKLNPEKRWQATDVQRRKSRNSFPKESIQFPVHAKEMSIQKWMNTSRPIPKLMCKIGWLYYINLLCSFLGLSSHFLRLLKAAVPAMILAGQ